MTKKPECCTTLLRDLDLNGCFGVFKIMEHGTLNLENRNMRTGKV
jgi:hypothetical protein